MAYTRPAASAADLTWLGVTAYTRPAATAADFTADYGLVTGISPATQFGTPTGRMNYFQTAAGFTSTNFSTLKVKPGGHVQLTSFAKFGYPTLPLKPTSIGVVTHFGTPVSGPGYKGVRPIVPTTAFGLAHVVAGQVMSGTVSTSFGTPFTTGGHWEAHSFPPSTRFSTAYTAFTQISVATGFASSTCGVPLSTKSGTYPLSWYCQAFGATSTVFGSPHGVYRQAKAAGAWAVATHVGTPQAIRGAPTTSIHSTQMGMPTAKVVCHGHGFRATTFGTGKVRLTCHATGLHRATRFGLPKQFGPHEVYGIDLSGRFGQPTGWVRINRKATGFCGTTMGATVTSHEHHIASHIAPTAHFPPVVAFSTPLLHRIT